LIQGASPLRLGLRPSVHFRPHQVGVGNPLDQPYTVASVGDRHELRCDPFPPLQLRAVGSKAELVLDGGSFRKIHYRTEAARGYESEGILWSPGYLRAVLLPGKDLSLIASVEPLEAFPDLSGGTALEVERTRRRRLLQNAPPEAREGLGAELVLAADQFLIVPASRPADTARLQAEGDEAVTMIAGYHWFTDWGRDTMISLEGLALGTGRIREATSLLLTFAHYIKEGLIPNQFPEGRSEGIYNTADATLWFFHAIDVYRRRTGDPSIVRTLFPSLRRILEAHLRGTRFGIRVDPIDGLLTQGESGYALTWMDAKVGDWVVTPRRGKAVEINALWYNALRLMEAWSLEEKDPVLSADLAQAAGRVYDSFNRRFWIEAERRLYDVIDGESALDAALRPNQLFAVSLPHPVLDPAKWEPVLRGVVDRLLTPVGLRSLEPGHPDYRSKYDGDILLRDGAYHQGTVWAWLIGPLVDAWLRVYPQDRAGARRLLEGFPPHLDEGCVGSVSEIFDAKEPYIPRGCIAQAWSVAELLRAWIRTAPDAPLGDPLQERQRQGSEQPG